MFDYKEQIFEFIKRNFEPTYPDLANAKFTTKEFLGFLFQVFPVGCISDYELNEILLQLEYERFTYSVETVKIEMDKYGNTTEVKKYNLCFGWCMFISKTPN
jgi:hypothetical protein